MADTITLRTSTERDVIKIVERGPQGPAGGGGGGGSGTVTSVALTSSDLTITGSPITTSGTITANLANSGATAGTYTKVTVDAKGRVTAGFTATASDIDAAESNHNHQPADIYCDAVKVTATTQSAGEPNGVYFRDGSDNGKATYKSGAGYSIWWDNEQDEWVIGNVPQTARYFIGSGDTNFPWQVSTAWTLGPQGSGTVPAVGQATLTDYQLNAAQDSISTRAPKSGNATSTEVVLGSDTRLTNSRTPLSHAASHAASGGDPVFDQDLNTTDYPTFLGIQLSGGDVTWGLNNILSGFGNSIDFENGILDSFGMNAQADAFRIQDESDPSKEARFNAGGITTGTLREFTFPNASGTLALVGDLPTSHAHGNLTSDGKVGSVSGLPLVTTTSGAITTLALGSAGQVLKVNSGGTAVEFTAAAAGGTKTYAVFTAEHNQPPASAFATLDTRNSIAVLDFDDATDESAVFVSVMPEGASLGSGLKIRLHWMATSATSGNCVWDMSLERMTTDLDTDSFDTIASATAAANGTAGILTVTEITLTTIDSVTAGDGFRLKVTRDANNASDTMSGDAELVVCEVRSAV